MTLYSVAAFITCCLDFRVGLQHPAANAAAQYVATGVSLIIAQIFKSYELIKEKNPCQGYEGFFCTPVARVLFLFLFLR